MGYHNHANESSFTRGQSSIDWQVRQAVEELRKKGENVVTAAKQALAEGAGLIVNDMKRRVPVRTGRLRDSIKAKSQQDGAIYEFSADARNPKDDFLYGQILEFSTWRKVRGKKVSAKKRAFMYPALDANRETVNKMVKNAIEQAFARG